MFEAFGKIPKGVNIIIFIWAAVGLVLMLRDPKFRKEKLFYVSLVVIGFMVIWRILYGIDTSRYAAALILPFTVFAAYLLYDSGKKRHFLVRLALYIALACSGFILPKMIQDSVFRNYSSDVMSEMFRDLDKTHRDYIFRTPGKDFSRILFASNLRRNIKVYVWDDESREQERERVHKYVINYKTVYPDSVFNVDARTIKGDKEVWDRLGPKQIASLVEDTRKEKKQLVFILSSDNQCVPVSENRFEPYRPNLLDNGDLEALDSPEESFDKLKANIGIGALDHDGPDPAVRTPRSAFFSSASGNVDATPPEVSVQNDLSIAGDHSARIRAADDAASLMFDKRFSNGKYEFSMLAKGETGTSISVVCEVCKDSGREVRTIAKLTLPDRRLYRITTHLSIDDLNDDDYFLAGVSVKNGEAYFDNFSMMPAASAVQMASAAD